MTESAQDGPPLRCGVIGVGRMGRHHARVYAQTTGADLVAVLDQNPERARDITEQWGGHACASLEELLDRGIDAVTVATPTTHHRDAVLPLLRAGVSCLVEKPLAPDIEQSRAIADEARHADAVLQVGHIVRFDPVMVAVREIDDLRPRFIEIDRISPMTFRSVDVGVVLDMMIHDLDLLLMMLGREPATIQASAVAVLGDVEDVCNARLTFSPDADGATCVANVTASRLALKTERKLRIISEDCYISADFGKRSITFVQKTANASQLEDLRQRLRAGEDLSSLDYASLMHVETLPVGDDEPLKLQIEDFLHAVRTGRQPTIDAEAGFAAVRTAERIVEAARASGDLTI